MLSEEKALSQSYLVQPYSSCGEVLDPYYGVAEVTRDE